MSEHKYFALAGELREKIIYGQIKAGDRLPSENDLMKLYGLSRQTVRHAMQLLVSEGLAKSIRGSGTYAKPVVQAKSHNIAIIATYIGEYIFPSVLSGAEEELRNNGYTPMLAVTHNRIDNERKVLQDFIKKQIDGMLVEGTKTALPNPNTDLYRQIMDMNIPIVFFHGYFKDIKRSVYVVTADRQGGYDLCSHLIEKGHVKIASIFKSDDMQGHDRFSGMTAALIEHNLGTADENVLWFTTENRDRVIRDYALDTIGDCTAVICYNDYVAVNLIQMLTNRGIRVPEDIAVASFDNSTYSEIGGVKITSLNHPKDELGRLAARKLINMINGKTEKSEVMHWDIVKKQST